MSWTGELTREAPRFRSQEKGREEATGCGGLGGEGEAKEVLRV